MKNLAPAISPRKGIGDHKPQNQAVLDWVHDVELLTKPENIFWCDGSDREHEFLLEQAKEPSINLVRHLRRADSGFCGRSVLRESKRRCGGYCATKQEAGSNA